MKHLIFGLLILALLGLWIWAGRLPGAVPMDQHRSKPELAQEASGQRADASLLAPRVESRVAVSVAAKGVPSGVLDGLASQAASQPAAVSDGSAVPLEVHLERPYFRISPMGSGGPTANKRCVVEARLTDGTAVKRTLVTDKYGRASTTIPRAAVRVGPYGKTTDVVVRLTEPGCQERFAFARAPNPRARELRLKASLTIIEGATARGRVVDRGSGSPVAIDSVDAIGLETAFWGPFPFSQGSQGWVQWTQDGRFEVHFKEPCTVELLARSHGHGSGSLVDVALSAVGPAQDLLIEVSGRAKIVGALTGSDGRAPLPTELRAVSAQIHENEWTPSRRGKPTDAAREGSGLLEATTWSRSDGSFEFGGLRTGEYTVLAKVTLFDDPGYLKLGEVMAASEPEPMLGILNVPHLVIELVDASGQPWKPRAGSIGQPPSDVKRGAWPVEPRVTVRDAGPLGGPLLVRDQNLARHWPKDEALSSPDRLIVRVAAGRQYQVGVIGGPFGGSVELAEVRANDSAIFMRFQANPPAGFGLLELSAPEVDGRSLSGYCAEVLDTDDPGSVLLTHGLFGEQPWRIELPAGDYDVRFRGTPMFTSHFMVPPPDSSDITRRVRITEGQTRAESFKLRGGGTLKVTVEGQTPSAPAHSVDELHEDTWP